MSSVTHWDRRMLGLAAYISSWSKDPSTQVGAVIERPNHTVASYGFNGFPRGVADFKARYEQRDLKYAMVVHAEANAIIHAKESLEGMTMYLTMPPCSGCAGLIIQSGISKVVYVAPSADFRERWSASMSVAKQMFDEAGVVLKEIDQ